MNSLLNTDFYKVGHFKQYPDRTEYVYSIWIPRKSRIPSVNHVVHFGLQHFIKKWLIDDFNQNFFNVAKPIAVQRYKRIISNAIGDISCSHIEYLWDLQYLPLKIKSLPEGTIVPIRCPCVTIVNTHPDFFWLTNYIETLFSAEVWGPTTSATIAYEYRKLLDKYCEETGGDPNFVQFQGHDFSMRGMYGVEAAKLSGMGHLTSFVGTDTIPTIYELEKYYNADSNRELVGCSVPATEHSVMCAGSKEGEYETFRRLIEDVYPSGIVSIVSDSWDLWKVLTEYLPRLKDKILARDGKVVIRPDSGDPVNIICGRTKVYDNSAIDREIGNIIVNGVHYKDNGFTNNHRWEVAHVIDPNPLPQDKGVIELLWEVFGGTINEKGYKVLDPHIGAIYGDSITLERAEQICERLKEKGFCSTNIVFGIGSYTYQYVTRDTFGFAMKATWCQIKREGHNIFKDPITDDGTKKSPKGKVMVYKQNGNILFKDECTDEEERLGLLETVFLDSTLTVNKNIEEIRNRIKNEY